MQTKGGYNMFKIRGKYETADIMTNTIDTQTITAIHHLLNQSFVQGNKICFMPDLHAGKGCVIGTTMSLHKQQVCPNIVGVDIGCGVLVVKLGKIKIDLPTLDDYIRKNIPHGFNANEAVQSSSVDSLISQLHCYNALIHIDRLEKSLKSLGGGNHFIEIDTDNEDNKYLLVHSGSRNLGKQVAEYYQNEAIKNMQQLSAQKKQDIIEQNKKCNTPEKINNMLHQLKDVIPPKDLSYLDGELLNKYFNDIKICQLFAIQNRALIARDICLNGLHMDLTQFTQLETFESVHNYIDFSDTIPILRKGAISAKAGEKLIIPINMRDGAILGTGLGNSDWNYSAPHGAGRLLSRSQAKEQIALSDFQETMTGIYSTSVTSETIDESPMAYKSLDYILNRIQDTVKVDIILKPIYNFKA